MADSEKDVKIRISLEDQISKQLDEVIAKDKQLAKDTEDLNAALVKVAGAFTAMSVAGLLAINALIQASDEQEVSTRRLLAALEEIGQNTPEISNKMLNFASNMQQLTGVADESLIPSLSRLTLEFGDAEMAMKVMPGLMAAAEIKGVDLNTTIRAMESALNGQTGALSRYGIHLDDTTSKEAIMNGVINETNKFLPQLGISTDTLAGKMRVIALNIKDLKEPLGDVFNLYLKPLAEEIRLLTVDLNEWAKSNKEFLTGLLALGTGISIFMTGLSTLGLALAGLPRLINAIEIGFLTLAKTVVAFGTHITSIIGLIASPTGLIITVGALIASMILLPKETEKAFKTTENIITESVAYISNTITVFVDNLSISIYNKIINYVTQLVDAIGMAGNKIFDKLLNMGLNLSKNIGIGIRNALYSAIASVSDGLNALIDKYNSVVPNALRMSRFNTSGLGQVPYETGAESGTISGKGTPSTSTAGIGKYQGMTAAQGTPSGTRGTPSGINTATVAKQTTEQQVFEKYGIELVGAEPDWAKYGIEYEPTFGIQTDTGFTGSVTPDYRYFKGDQAALDKELQILHDEIYKKSGTTININNDIKGSVMTENELIEVIKKALKASGQSGDAYSF